MTSYSVSPYKEPMAFWTHLHTCSSSSTLSMGECVLCIRTSFCFTLSTSRLSGTPVRTPRRSMAASPFRRSRFWVRHWLLPSWLCSSTRALSSWDLRGRSTQENMARSSARAENRNRAKGFAFGRLKHRIVAFYLFQHLQVWSRVYISRGPGNRPRSSLIVTVELLRWRKCQKIKKWNWSSNCR